MAVCCFISSDIGWPIPPAAPRTATFCWFYESYHKRKFDASLEIPEGPNVLTALFENSPQFKQIDYLGSYWETSYNFAGAM